MRLRLLLSLTFIFNFDIVVSQAASAEQMLVAENQTPPPFLPSYYLPSLQIDQIRLSFFQNSKKDNHDSYIYKSEDQNITLSINYLTCDMPKCRATYDNALLFFNTPATKNKGQFKKITSTEFHVEWSENSTRATTFAAMLPNALQFWTVTADSRINVDNYVASLMPLISRQRYEEALRGGNIEMGHWGVQIYNFAQALLKENKKAEANVVLKDLLATSPTHYEAHMTLAEVTSDRAAAKNSATVILNNSEDMELVAKAAKLLNMAEPDTRSIPVLESGEKGLQLILIPLPPCNLRLVTEAAALYEKTYNIPVKIRRLPEEWKFAKPDRILNERAVQQLILQRDGPSIDFTGWTRERYGAQILRTADSVDALNKFLLKETAAKIAQEPDQYFVQPYLYRLIDLLVKYRSTDIRTMYVGITEANIFTPDANFVFSAYADRTQGGAGAGILSYSTMQAKILGEPTQSRKRLVERITKELVPASFKALNIPRPADPTDPYSYSSGIERLNEKALTLSPPVRKALDKFR